MTLFGTQLFADLISSGKIRSYWIRMGPTPGAWCLHRERRELQTQRHRHTEKADGDRQRLGACGHSPGTLSPQKLKEAPSPGAPGGARPATPPLALPAPGLGASTFLLLEAVGLWGFLPAAPGQQ